MDRGAWRTWGYTELDMTAQQQPNGDDISIYLVRMDEVSSLGQRIQVKSWFCHVLTLDKWALVYENFHLPELLGSLHKTMYVTHHSQHTVHAQWKVAGVMMEARIKLELCLQMPSLVLRR